MTDPQTAQRLRQQYIHDSEAAPASSVAQRHRLTLNAQVEKFVLAGNATLTLVSVNTGKRYTFRVAKPDDFKADRPIWFVSVLKGADNERDFGYIGQIRIQRGCYVYERGRKCWADWFAASDAFSWVWKHVTLDVDSTIDARVEIWHEGRCGRCGRKLTVPESIESGFGPECVGKL